MSALLHLSDIQILIVMATLLVISAIIHDSFISRG